VVGLTPDPTGRLPEQDCQRCAEFGREIQRRFGSPVAETSGHGTLVSLPLKTPTRIEHVAIMEEITQGERVRAYVVEGRVAGGTWQPLCQGISIGHKRIQRFDPIEVSAVRLRLTSSVAAPMIRKLSVFSVEA